MFDEMNYQKTVAEDVDTDSMEFKKLKEFIGQEIILRGFFFTNSKKGYGKQVVCVSNDYKINMPNHAVALFERIASNTEMVTALCAGKAKLTNIEEKDTNKGNPTVIFEIKDV